MKKQKPLDEIKAEILDAQENDPVVGGPAKNVELIGTSSRRGFLKTLGISAVLVALGGQLFAMLRSLFPNVLYEPPQKFKVGTLDKFTDGGTFLEDKRLFIFRQQNTFHAISAACTHLGCTVKMVKLNQPKKVTAGGKEIDEQVEFHCPCHGSKYYGDGTNYAGPAPRPLDYFNLEVSPDDGQLIVDMAKKVEQDYRLTT
ncbi:MAG: ubiquinol-cytochrome c reductase iron-sulfur subunit [Acidobacteria bacterium]|nr:ubiquinol-cytochrome c reductase iron-sulfur subunit [Acidobacteriota bacterium]